MTWSMLILLFQDDVASVFMTSTIACPCVCCRDEDCSGCTLLSCPCSAYDTNNVIIWLSILLNIAPWSFVELPGASESMVVSMVFPDCNQSPDFSRSQPWRFRTQSLAEQIWREQCSESSYQVWNDRVCQNARSLCRRRRHRQNRPFRLIS